MRRSTASALATFSMIMLGVAALAILMIGAWGW